MQILFNLCSTLAYEEVSKNQGQLAKLDIRSNIEEAIRNIAVILITIYIEEYFLQVLSVIKV